MEIEAHLRKGHSREFALELTAYIGNSQERFDEFMPYFLHEEYRICQRASWTLGMVCKEYPSLMLKWMHEIIQAVKAPKHDAVVRNFVRTIQFLDPIPEEYEGEIYDLCFEYLFDPKYPIAFKAFSMTVCRRIAMKYPELKNELIPIIEELIMHGSSGIISRGKKELKMLQK